jgi:hypothetical protein
MTVQIDGLEQLEDVRAASLDPGITGTVRAQNDVLGHDESRVSSARPSAYRNTVCATIDHQPMTLRRAVLLVPLLLAMACRLTSAGERWTMVRSQSITVIGDQSPGTLRDVAERIETFRAGIGTLIPKRAGARGDADRRVRVRHA